MGGEGVRALAGTASHGRAQLEGGGFFLYLFCALQLEGRAQSVALLRVLFLFAHSPSPTLTSQTEALASDDDMVPEEEDGEETDDDEHAGSDSDASDELGGDYEAEPGQPSSSRNGSKVRALALVLSTSQLLRAHYVLLSGVARWLVLRGSRSDTLRLCCALTDTLPPHSQARRAPKATVKPKPKPSTKNVVQVKAPRRAPPATAL
jgi:hypothetical protein